MFSECWLDVNQQWKNSTDGFILPFVFAQLLLTEETNSDKLEFENHKIMSDYCSP